MAEWSLPDPEHGPVSDVVLDADGNLTPEAVGFVRWLQARPEATPKRLGNALAEGVVLDGVQGWYDQFSRTAG